MKNFLSIGTGPGMGYETAARFAREGFRIILSARNAEKSEELSRKLKDQGFSVECRRVDASSAESIADLMSEVQQQFGDIDVIHYNAAAMRQDTIDSQPAKSFNEDLAVNIGGALAATKMAAAEMSTRKNGTILLTGGGFALAPHPEFISLSIGKAGIRSLVMGLFEPLKKDNVHIATVTVSASVTADSKEARDVGELFWQLHSQPADQWTFEMNYSA
ncbi:SDR family NAD(P)-dependent oxidoreductase [Winslowiella iniecta]|uniref:Short-chain dehydrogenase n=1 Tax=Winslowiella iniecta TaxID=1560201 RepID=A0A0L7T4J5_9GAMM|nr:SDR family NAD(P)-dependent oxidoreductase [Winslowiella iniecta]KOC90302.1 short-chain dehydrogenase [Winslowiella iniecta]KOC94736.1 short-chain dehydrogenase [Winslowiella iniecta]